MELVKFKDVPSMVRADILNKLEFSKIIVELKKKIDDFSHTDVKTIVNNPLLERGVFEFNYIDEGFLNVKVASEGSATIKTYQCIITVEDCLDILQDLYNKVNVSHPDPTYPFIGGGGLYAPYSQKNPCEDCDFYQRVMKSGKPYVGDVPCHWCDKSGYKPTWATTTGGHSIDNPLKNRK